jgi:hypothetical protein
VRSTTFLFISWCTLVAKIQVNFSQTLPVRHFLAGRDAARAQARRGARRTAASASRPTRAFLRPHLPEAGSTPKPLEVSPCHVPRLPSPVGRTTMDRRSVPSPVRTRPPRLPPYHGWDAIVPFVTKQAAAAYLRTLRQPRVCRRPCLPELAAGRHSRRHCGAPSCAPFHTRPSCPTPSLVPTEAHPTALSHGHASTIGRRCGAPSSAAPSGRPTPEIDRRWAPEHYPTLPRPILSLPRPDSGNPRRCLRPGTQLQGLSSFQGPVRKTES